MAFNSLTARRSIWAIALLMAGSACAGAGGREASRASFQRNIGIATARDAFDRVLKVLREYHYEVLNEDSVPEIRIETHWKERAPFADEQELGISLAENRIIVNGRVRQNTEFGSLYNIQLSIENRVRLMDNPEWVETSATPLYRAYADSLTTRMQRELTIGVRRY